MGMPAGASESRSDEDFWRWIRTGDQSLRNNSEGIDRLLSRDRELTTGYPRLVFQSRPDRSLNPEDTDGIEETPSDGRRNNMRERPRVIAPIAQDVWQNIIQP